PPRAPGLPGPTIAILWFPERNRSPRMARRCDSMKRILALVLLALLLPSLTGCAGCGCRERLRNCFRRGAICGSRTAPVATAPAPIVYQQPAPVQQVQPQYVQPQYVQPQVPAPAPIVQAPAPRVVTPQYTAPTMPCCPCVPCCPPVYQECCPSYDPC